MEVLSMSRRMRRRIRLAAAATIAAAVVGSLAPHLGPPEAYHIDKIVHLGGYAVLTFLLTLAMPPRWGLPAAALVAALSAILLGGILEIAQTVVPGRDGSWGDFAVDAVGSVVGLIFMRLWLSRKG
jgi:VanZ family protein